MINTKTALVGILSLGILMSSCKKEVEETPIGQNPDNTDYEAVLTQAILDASEGQGAFYYMLPDEIDLSSIPQDDNNQLTIAKIELGRLLFHESGLGLNPRMEGVTEEEYSCASCHHAWAGFQANLQQGIGEGGVGFGIAGEARTFNPDCPIDSVDVQPLRTPTALNGAYQQVMLWNGAFGANGPNKGTEHLWGPMSPMWNNHFGHDGLESQAIGGLTVHRLKVDEDIVTDLGYKDMFDAAFPEWPEATRYTARTAGLAIAAYERTLLSNQAPFQDWLRGDEGALTDNQKKGAILFFDKAQCFQCHNGPALNSMTFHALGMKDMEPGPGVFLSDDFHNANKGRGGFTAKPEDLYKFKTPQLYNLKDSPFFGHGGTYHSVKEVIEYKNEAVSDNPIVPDTQLSPMFIPLDLTEDEINQLVDFIENGLYDPDLMRYVPDEVNSGNCIPNNDEMSSNDQGCIQ